MLLLITQFFYVLEFFSLTKRARYCCFLLFLPALLDSGATHELSSPKIWSSLAYVNLSLPLDTQPPCFDFYLSNYNLGQTPGKEKGEVQNQIWRTIKCSSSPPLTIQNIKSNLKNHHSSRFTSSIQILEKR